MTDCVHEFIIEPQNGKDWVAGSCRHCHAVKQFPNTWEATKTMTKKRPRACSDVRLVPDWPKNIEVA